MNTAIAEPASAYMITAVGKTDDCDYFFTERTAELWRMWNAVRPTKCEEYAIMGWGNGHQHTRMKTSGISLMLTRLCEKVGVRPFRAHALRHAKIKRNRKKVGIEMASILVDHSDIDTTRGYANVDDDEIAAAAGKTGLKINIWK
jgi:integrase